MGSLGEIKRILLATDGSEYSAGAVREAFKLAKATNAKVYVLSVAQVTIGQLIYSPDIVESVEEEVRKTLENCNKKAQEENIEAECLCHEGEEPYQFIIEEAQKKDVDVIILGRRGRRGLKKLLMGSVTALVIGHSPVPVFVVPRAGKLVFKKILLCTDGTEFSKKAEDAAISIAKRWGSSLIAISVARRDKLIEEAGSVLEAVKERAKQQGLDIDTIIEVGTPYERIIEAAATNNVDLVVLGTHGRTGLTHLLMGSVAERVIGLVHCASLVAK